LQGKQTYQQLAKQHHCSARTIRRRLDELPLLGSCPEALPGTSVVVLDTTYFGRGFGVMVIKDARTRANLFAAPLAQETISLYQAAVTQLRQCHCRIDAVVCDGRRGLFKAFGEVPVQMCHFHQAAIVCRYLTRSPKLPASKALLRLALTLPRSKEADFTAALTQWECEWEAVLNERSEGTQGKRTRYTHPRLRSAYRSLSRNLPWLFTFLRYPQLGIPNTTNLLDGQFSDLKNKLRNHNGLTRKRRLAHILRLLSPALVDDFRS
jgi:hypothetical protein